jgi:phospholipase/lecithinase/hemolysin
VSSSHCRTHTAHIRYYLRRTTLAKHPDIRIANSDWGLFLDEVITNPAKYGLTDTTHPCAGRAIHHEDTTPCASPDTHFFYHEGHPSTAAHRAVGDLLYKEALTAP